MFKYETHVHSRECSACAKNSAREMVQAYHNAGYSGFVLTDHFIWGNTSDPRNIDWKTRMQMYYDAYLDAKDEGNKMDFDVLFGIEHRYDIGKEILIYGIDIEFLISHPELEHADIDTYAKMVHAIGGILIHAHPYRERDYIPKEIEPRLDVCDGIEIYNAHDEIESNEKARKEALKSNKIRLSGGDNHYVEYYRIGMAGMAFENRIRTIAEFVSAIKANIGKPIINGVVENI